MEARGIFQSNNAPAGSSGRRHAPKRNGAHDEVGPGVELSCRKQLNSSI
jgi:hypothetical protein